MRTAFSIGKKQRKLHFWFYLNNYSKIQQQQIIVTENSGYQYPKFSASNMTGFIQGRRIKKRVQNGESGGGEYFCVHENKFENEDFISLKGGGLEQNGTLNVRSIGYDCSLSFKGPLYFLLVFSVFFFNVHRLPRSLTRAFYWLSTTVLGNIEKYAK